MTTAELLDQPTMSVLELAKVLRISRGAAYALARSGRVRTLRIGRRIIVPSAAVRELLGDPGLYTQVNAQP